MIFNICNVIFLAEWKYIKKKNDTHVYITDDFEKSSGKSAEEAVDESDEFDDSSEETSDKE